MLSIELLNGVVHILVSKTATNLTIMQATLNLVPILGIANPLLQPIGVITEPVLLIPTIGHGLPSTLVGNSKDKDGKDEEKNYEEEHDQKVEPEEPRNTATSSDQASYGDHHEKNAECDDGFVEPTLARGVGLSAQPYPSTEDWD